MTQHEAFDWLHAVHGELYCNNRHPSGRDAWVAIVRMPPVGARGGKLIVALGERMLAATTAAAHQWLALRNECGPIH